MKLARVSSVVLRLQRRFASGPIDFAVEFGNPEPAVGAGEGKRK